MLLCWLNCNIYGIRNNTTKDENDYNVFLSSHGGSSNAFTDMESTNYYFDVSKDFLEGALDRFAQFFINPLFNEGSTDRELQAVDSEHAKNLQNDAWRSFQLSKSLCRKSKFGCMDNFNIFRQTFMLMLNHFSTHCVFRSSIF